MKKYFLYSHGGSNNHGCEALVRTTCELLEEFCDSITLISSKPQEDLCYGLEKYVDIKKAGEKGKVLNKNLKFFKAYAALKFKHDYRPIDWLSEINAINAKKEDIAICIGGDSYCYKSDVDNLLYMHDMWKYNNMKTVYWGCSIEPELLKDERIASDIRQFDLITARESISYEALKKVNPNTILTCDSAFKLKISQCDLPEKFEVGNTIGINVSPLSIGCSNNDIVFDNYVELIKYIIEETDMHICLIPHVIWSHDDDRVPLSKLYSMFSYTGRISLLTNRNAQELKYVISHCRLFVGARTHATIAAYSTYVPTLVVGYSVKSRGIARDIFGTEENYVISAQSMKKNTDLLERVIWLVNHEGEIAEHLRIFIPNYSLRINDSVNKLKKL